MGWGRKLQSQSKKINTVWVPAAKHIAGLAVDINTAVLEECFEHLIHVSSTYRHFLIKMKLKPKTFIRGHQLIVRCMIVLSSFWLIEI